MKNYNNLTKQVVKRPSHLQVMSSKTGVDVVKNIEKFHQRTKNHQLSIIMLFSGQSAGGRYV